MDYCKCCININENLGKVFALFDKDKNLKYAFVDTRGFTKNEMSILHKEFTVCKISSIKTTLLLRS